MSLMKLAFSSQQSLALDAVRHWLDDPKRNPVFRLFGYAGTGKTTIAKDLAAQIEGTVVFAALSGKAAMVMARNGCVGATTIHSLIYSPRVLPNGSMQWVINRKSAAASAKLIVIDEVSMVSRSLAEDILSFNVPVLVLGDPAQLPPPDGAGYFTQVKPDIMLTEIHRQALGNPILELATAVREGKSLKIGSYGNSCVMQKGDLTNDHILSVDQVLVGKNESRHTFNKAMREIVGFTEKYPMVGERLVCLRNNREIGLMNGGTFAVMNTEERPDLRDPLCFDLKSEDIPKLNLEEVDVSRSCFDNPAGKVPSFDDYDGELFDYAYALTVHKAQGSQWPSVMVFDESDCFRQDRQLWLYTAITRAADQVMIFID